MDLNPSQSLTRSLEATQPPPPQDTYYYSQALEALILSASKVRKILAPYRISSNHHNEVFYLLCCRDGSQRAPYFHHCWTNANSKVLSASLLTLTHSSKIMIITHHSRIPLFRPFSRLDKDRDILSLVH